MKKWFDVGIHRVIRNGKGEAVRRNVQHVIVWGKEEEALGLAFRRAPDPFAEDDRRRDTYCEIEELRDNFDLQGRKMEEVVEEIDDGSAYGLDAEDLEKMLDGAPQA